jgi:hypothetical protein
MMFVCVKGLETWCRFERSFHFIKAGWTVLRKRREIRFCMSLKHAILLLRTEAVKGLFAYVSEAPHTKLESQICCFPPPCLPLAPLDLTGRHARSEEETGVFARL